MINYNYRFLPRYLDEKGTGRLAEEVVKSPLSQRPEDIAYAQYVKETQEGKLLGRSINKGSLSDIVVQDKFFGSGRTLNPFFAPYKRGFDTNMSEFLQYSRVPTQSILDDVPVKYRLAAIASIPKMLEQWEGLKEAKLSTAFRGSNYPMSARYESSPRFMSFSESPSVAKGFAGFTPTNVVAIDNDPKYGRRLAARDVESEVLYRPNLIYKKVGNVKIEANTESGEAKIPKYQVVGERRIVVPTFEDLVMMSKQQQKFQQSPLGNQMYMAMHYDTPLKEDIKRLYYTGYRNDSQREMESVMNRYNLMQNIKAKKERAKSKQFDVRREEDYLDESLADYIEGYLADSDF